MSLPDLRSRAELHAEIERLRAALAFYAEPKNYIQTGWQGDPNLPAALLDKGAIARSATE